ncbi:hypothetical protein [Novosphingobium mathurense]|uniref:Uncharacterized protein n=1 Tax=Novosphingobium mathurense TaxID=428990 RepID=A0A1U6IVI5_9SPHN|nr:hypothetical protein [Novosphingobium mathurense]SLK12035.1 hypothetical protein SAMN06295987_11719 [Novosphingobium mathurense]
MVDLHSKIHSSTLVAQGAGINPATLRGYYSRGKFRALGEAAEQNARQEQEKGGQPARYNARGAMHVALAVELIRYGFDGEQAFNDAAVILIGDEQRHPGGCFRPNYGPTLFIYARGQENHEDAIWIAHEEEFNKYIASKVRKAVSFLSINLTVLEQRVFSALGLSGNSWDDLPDTDGDDTGVLIRE